jgi:hypothetical protein
MRRTSEREQVRGIAARWEEAYFDHRLKTWLYGDDKRLIHGRLAALDPEVATAADVAAIIGNSSWIEPFTCTECCDRNWSVVLVGDEPDFESHTAYACPPCLRKLVALAESEST